MFHLISREEAAKLMDHEEPWPWYGQLMKAPQTMAYLLQIDFWLKHYKVSFTF